jgi:hypothetical protein
MARSECNSATKLNILKAILTKLKNVTHIVIGVTRSLHTRQKAVHSIHQTFSLFVSGIEEIIEVRGSAASGTKANIMLLSSTHFLPLFAAISCCHARDATTIMATSIMFTCILLCRDM